MKNQKISSFTTIALALGCFAFLPQLHAVSPPPDGCYGNYTTAEGCKALMSLTTGFGNTGIGWYSLFSDTNGSYNTGVGGGALALNTGSSNTAMGAAALLLNSSGNLNTALGTDAMVYNNIGENNTAVGAFSLFHNTQGNDNTAIGYQALYSNVGGANSGNLNTATGTQALYSNTAARFNSAFGVQALYSNDLGEDNSAFGYQALHDNQSFTGFANSAFGSHALDSNADGQQNSAFGYTALGNNVHGDDNTAMGSSAGVLIDGDGNVCIGAFVPGEAGVNNTTYIRNVNTLAQPIVSGVDGVTVRLTDGRIGHGVSSRRYKHDIQPMDNASEALYALKPVTFHYNKDVDVTQTLDFGLIAEEVAEVNPELVVRDREGKISNYRRDAVNAMLLNEFLKEHKKVQDLEARLGQQQKQIESLTAGLERVSAQVETSGLATKVAVTEQ